MMARYVQELAEFHELTPTALGDPDEADDQRADERGDEHRLDDEEDGHGRSLRWGGSGQYAAGAHPGTGLLGPLWTACG